MDKPPDLFDLDALHQRLETPHVLRIETHRYCFWRNTYAHHPVLLGTVFFGDAFDWTTQRLSPALLSSLMEKMPGAVPDSGPIGAAELVAGIAQRIQLLGDVTARLCGAASRNDAQRRAVLFFSCRDMFLAPRSLLHAVQIANGLIQPEFSAERLARMFKRCADMVEAHGLGRTTLDMAEAAERRGIPWFRPNDVARHIRLGQGFRQQHFGSTTFEAEASFGCDYSRDRLLTFSALAQIGLPAGRFAVVKDVGSARRSAEKVGYPLVLKPVDGMGGQPVCVDLRNDEQLRAALAIVRIHEREYLLQSYFSGSDHRLLVVAGKLVAAARRIPAGITEEGLHRVDVMDTIHRDNAQAVVRAAKAVGLNNADVVFISPDIAKSWREVGGGIGEVRAAAGLPPDGPSAPSLNVRGKTIDVFCPDGDDGRILAAMITGTKGKTTTTGMLASILSVAGHTVGYATTEGVTIDGERVADGDLASWNGAAIVLRDPTVTAAVLETPRGGLVKYGMYLDHCDVAALLNVQLEQIGMDGIETLDDMAVLKRKVLDAARKAVVLNADDPRCLKLAPEFSRSVRTFLFSRNWDSQALGEHLARGGDALFLDKHDGNETIMVASGSNTTPLLRTAELPVTVNGLFWQHASAAMAAAALAIGLSIDMDTIKEGLKRYGREFPAATCRLSFQDGFPTRILFDFTASPPGFAAMVSVTDTISVAGKRICAVTVVGNRPDWVFAESAAALAGHFQRYVCFEREGYRRGRKPGEISARLAEALIAAGVPPASVTAVQTYVDAARVIAGEAAEDDFVAVFGTDSSALVDKYRAAFQEIRRPA